MINIFKKIFGTRNERILRVLWRNVKKINELEPDIQALTDAAAARQKLQNLKSAWHNGASLNDLLPEAFAVVREASRRTLGMRHFDVQLIGGMVLHSGKIAEMRPAKEKPKCHFGGISQCINRRGVHVVTVNDYLAKRDAEWMRPIYEFLGLTVAYNLANMNTPAEKSGL